MSQDAISIHPAVARATRRAIFFILAVSIIAFSGASEWLIRDLSEQLAAEQVRLLSINFLSSEGVDIAQNIERIKARTDTLIAVGVLGDSNRPTAVYPDELAFHAAVEAAAERSKPMAATVEVDGEPRSAWVIRDEWPGTAERAATPVVFILRRQSHLPGWALASTGCAAGVGLLALAVVRMVARWVERRIVHPLRGLGESLAKAHSPGEQIASTGGWAETEKIARRIDHLLSQLEESQAKSSRLERTKEWEMQKKEEGFHSQLRRVKNQATTDPLTGLKNRAFLEDTLEPLVEKQHKESANLALVMVDIDNFKHHNDTRGHAAGDEVLKFIGDLLRGSIRPTDHAIRYGGDEFMLLLPGTNAKQAGAVIERVVKLFAQYSSRFASEKPLSMSAGIASLDQLAVPDANALAAAADEALYDAKAGGKNSVSLHAVA